MEREPRIGALERALVHGEECEKRFRGAALGERRVDAEEDMWTAGLAAALALKESRLYGEGDDALVGEDLDEDEEGAEEGEEEEES